MSLRKSFVAAVAAAITAVFLSIALQPAKAATIAWGTPVTISGSSDVVTTGTLFASANFGPIATGTDVTVNGVTFNGFSWVSGSNFKTVTVGNITITGTQNLSNANYPSGASAAPYTSLPAAYQSLLRPTLFSNSNTVTFSLAGLTSGRSYLIQYWASDPTVSGSSRSVQIGSQTLDVNSTDAVGGVGQWVTGTFTADSSTQSFAATRIGSSPMYGNAMQVRLLAVPEPETLAMLGAGVAFVATCGKLRRRLSRHRGEASGVIQSADRPSWADSA